MLGGKSPANDTSDCGHSIVGGRLSIVENPDTSFETDLILLEPHGKRIEFTTSIGRHEGEICTTNHKFYFSCGNEALQ